jgi:hypothetical protein
MGYIYHPGNNKMKPPAECGSVTKKFGNAVLAALMSERNILKNGIRPSSAYFRFSKHIPLSKNNVVTELSMGKIYRQIILSNFGYSSFERVLVFFAEKEREGRALRSKMIQSRKRFLKAHKDQLDDLPCDQIHHKRLFGGLFIIALTPMLTKCRLCRL